MADVLAREEGKIWLFAPLTDEAQEWIEQHVSGGTFFGYALVVEDRFVEVLIEGMVDDGLEIDVERMV